MRTIVNTILVANLDISKIQVNNVKDVMMNAIIVNLLRTLVHAIVQVVNLWINGIIVNNVINIGNFMGKMQPLVNSILVAQLVRSKITVINVKNVMKIRK